MDRNGIMMLTNLFTGLIFLGGSLVTGASRYIAIPFDEIDVIEMNPTLPQIAPRYPRQVENYVPALVSGLRQDDSRGRQSREAFARSDSQIFDYVDFGAQTGDHGAYSWYADFPARRQ